MDVVDVQGLILSPGFPYNYSSGTHCVWQFFVPVGHQLILEIFDFDVFESHDASAQYGSVSEFDDEAYEGGPFTPAGSNDSGGASEKESAPQRDVSSKVPQYALKDEAKHVVVQEQSTKMEIARVSNSAKRSADAPSDPASPPPPSHPPPPGARPSGDNAAHSAPPAVRGAPNPGQAAEESTPTPDTRVCLAGKGGRPWRSVPRSPSAGRGVLGWESPSGAPPSPGGGYGPGGEPGRGREGSRRS